MMIIERGNTKVCFCQETLAVTVEKDQTRWEWTDGFQPKLICKEGSFSFLDAVTITHETYTMGVGIGIRSCFEGFEKDGVTYPYAFETLIWMEDTTEQVYFEWVPLKEEGLQVEKVLWPGQMAFEEKKDSWYTLLTHQQGILIPNDWEIPLSAIPFAGFFETAGGYMPWFGQVKDRQGYIAICTTPWNAGYYAEHPAGGPYTHVGVYFEPSLGKMDYRRVMRYTFLDDCDYNDLCKEYRSYVNEQGRLRTLEEKAARNPSVNELIGCAFVHKGIKTQVQHNSWYTLLTHQQGILIPNDWEIPLSAIPFAGFFETAGGYMPWFGQVKDRQGYIAICTTPWNAGYYAEHPAGGPYTHVGVYFEPSLGKMDYRRVMRYTFLDDCDYNDLCKEYRSYVNEQGRLRTLEEKAARNPSVNELIGCAFVHKGIKTQVQHNSDFFDPENPEKNNHLTTFAQRTKEIRELHEQGVEKLYLHLDGWAQPGYDNQHPDYLPACKEAGGWEDMKELADTMHECGYMFGIHDQYRDFYKAAPSFDENYACRLPDGSIPEHQRWAGGPQSYLCATQAPYYVKRNFTEIKKHGIRLDGAYLDVFTCNEGDECDNPEHRMTRRECYEFRGRCFEYLLSQGILPSSEEVSDWAVPSLVFCHYAPYDFMMKKPGTPKEGVPVPLYNLVYHDCVIQPWMMDKVSEAEDYMLYALLNGGAPYLIRDAAYPNIDGAFDDNVTLSRKEEIERSKAVTELHKQVAKCEMLHHEMVNGDYMVQETTFSDGTGVRVDFRKQTYQIFHK